MKKYIERERVVDIAHGYCHTPDGRCCGPDDVVELYEELKAIPTVDAVTIEELEQLRDEMAKCEGGDSYLIYCGHRFSTDMGYAFDGINMLIDCLKIKRERKGGSEDAVDN